MLISGKLIRYCFVTGLRVWLAHMHREIHPCKIKTCAHYQSSKTCITILCVVYQSHVSRRYMCWQEDPIFKKDFYFFLLRFHRHNTIQFGIKYNWISNIIIHRLVYCFLWCSSLWLNQISGNLLSFIFCLTLLFCKSKKNENHRLLKKPFFFFVLSKYHNEITAV